jgi:hypothetical protein
VRNPWATTYLRLRNGAFLPQNKFSTFFGEAMVLAMLLAIRSGENIQTKGKNA